MQSQLHRCAMDIKSTESMLIFKVFVFFHYILLDFLSLRRGYQSTQAEVLLRLLRLLWLQKLFLPSHYGREKEGHEALREAMRHHTQDQKEVPQLQASNYNYVVSPSQSSE